MTFDPLKSLTQSAKGVQEHLTSFKNMMGGRKKRTVKKKQKRSSKKSASPRKTRSKSRSRKAKK